MSNFRLLLPTLAITSAFAYYKAKQDKKACNVAVLASRNGTALRPAIEAAVKKQIPVNIGLVISDKQYAPILRYAKERNIPALYISPFDQYGQKKTREAYDAEVAEAIKKHKINVIALAGWMRIFSDEFIPAVGVPIMNVHPSRLPRHAGLMDEKVHESVLKAGDPISGCTIHLVEPGEVDSGSILIQTECEVTADETVASLKAKVQAQEAEAFLDIFTRLGAENINHLFARLIKEHKASANVDSGPSLKPR